MDGDVATAERIKRRVAGIRGGVKASYRKAMSCGWEKQTEEHLEKLP
jgi:hypothetical protein